MKAKYLIWLVLGAGGIFLLGCDGTLETLDDPTMDGSAQPEQIPENWLEPLPPPAAPRLLKAGTYVGEISVVTSNVHPDTGYVLNQTKRKTKLELRVTASGIPVNAWGQEWFVGFRAEHDTGERLETWVTTSVEQTDAKVCVRCDRKDYLPDGTLFGTGKAKWLYSIVDEESIGYRHDEELVPAEAYRERYATQSIGSWGVLTRQ